MCSDCPTHLDVTDEDEDTWEDEAFYASDEEE